MNNIIDNALGIHLKALRVGAERLEVLAGNVANADTPGYKARDIDFRSILARESGAGSTGGVTLSTTSPGHLPATGNAAAPELLYRIPGQPSLDGNTVDGDREKAAFLEASVRYQASLDFVGGKIATLRKALRGD